MEEKRTPSANNGLLHNIPEVIDPGITIPIYDDDELDTQQTQKLGSYRARAGKFSNTLSNLLPSISAKLHHSKKNGTVHGKNGEFSPTNSSSGSTVDLKAQQVSPLKPMKNFTATTTGNLSDLTPPQENGKLVHFPDTTNYMLNPPRSSNDSFQFNRSRNNTVSSQITSLSSLQPNTQTNANNLWTSVSNPPEAMQQQQMLQQFNSNNNPNILGMSNLNTITPVPSYYEPSLSQQKSETLNNTLTVPSSNVWGNNRQRSHSNTSSLYVDAQFYDQEARSRATSSYTISQQPLSQEFPSVGDEVDPRAINWVSMETTVPTINQINNLLPTNTITISNVFPLQQQQPQLNNTINLTSTSLATLCSKYGEVISSRTFKGLNIALVEFANVESAMRAKQDLQGKDVSVIGTPSNVSFAKILPMHHFNQQQQQLQQSRTADQSQQPQPLLQEQLYNGSVTFQQQGNVSVPVFKQYSQYQQPFVNVSNSTGNTYSYPTHATSHGGSSSNGGTATTATNEKEQCPFPLPPPKLSTQKSKLEDIIHSFDTKADRLQLEALINNGINYKGTNDTMNFGPLPEPLTSKDFDAPKLRELRKNIDANTVSDLELEQLALCMLDELPELSSDYLGNTIVQKLFEKSSDIVKDIMLRKTSKYLTSMGVHKNGTWACQKMITMAKTPRQIKLVSEGVNDYCTPLFNDQFGNYVIQCVLKFGFPWNDFIFQSIISNFWIVVQNRYGARAVRACLEAHDIVTTEQTLVLSAMIVCYSEYLASNNNGTLLLTWFLDTCVLPNRHSILAKRLLPNIVDLCRHRLASLTVLKILNYRGDDEARKILFEEIFGKLDSKEPPKVLTQILTDANYGPTFIYKILSMPLLEDEIRSHVIKQVRKILMEHGLSQQQHRRLMEEVGLAPTSASMQQGGGGSGSHRKSSLSHLGVYNPADANPSHMRGMSVSSVRSNGSRHNTQVPIPQGAIQQQQSQQQPVPIPSIVQQPMNNASTNSINAGYYNYPGMFPGS